jgi:hypothetical protein
MPRLRALKSWADRKTGDEFEASDSDARLLCAADAIGGQKATLVDRAMKAAEPQAELEPPAPASKQQDKRRYLRRDLRAQS